MERPDAWLDSHKDGKDDSSEHEEVHYCAACNKTFKSAMQFSNHEKSKKHLQKKVLMKKDFFQMIIFYTFGR